MKPPSSSVTPASSSPMPPVLGTEPSASRQWEPDDLAAVLERHRDRGRRRGVTDAIRDLTSTVMPRRRKTSSSTSAASGSSPGSTRSRLLTRVTSMPRAL